MKTLINFFAVGALTFLLFTSCGSDDGPSLTGTGISISDIQGNWTATRAVFDIAGTGASQRIDVVEEGGSVTLSIQANGRFTLSVTVPGRSAEVSTGQLGFDEDLLVVTYDDDPDEEEFFGIQSTSTTLSINGSAEFDFDGDGTEEPARAELDFVRS